MDKISRGVWPTHDTKTSMSPTASEPVAYRLVVFFLWVVHLSTSIFMLSVYYCHYAGSEYWW